MLGGGTYRMLRSIQSGETKPNCEEIPEKVISMLSLQGKVIVCQAMKISGSKKNIPWKGRNMCNDSEAKVCVGTAGAEWVEHGVGGVKCREIRVRKALDTTLMSLNFILMVKGSHWILWKRGVIICGVECKQLGKWVYNSGDRFKLEMQTWELFIYRWEMKFEV